MVVPDEVVEDVAPDTGADEAPQGTEAPVAGAGQPKAPAKNGDQTPAEGDTSAAGTGAPKGDEPMIPKSRLDEESRKVQVLTKKLKGLEALDSRLKALGQRFGRGSAEYLAELEAFYDRQAQGQGAPRGTNGNGQPAGSEGAPGDDRISRIEAGLNEIRENEAIREEKQKIQAELTAVRENPKYSVLKGGWEKWQKVILGRMSADIDLTAEDVAQELVDLLNSTKADYLKSKTEEGKRVVTSGGGGTPAARKDEKFTSMKDLDRMVKTVVKGARSRSAGE